MTKLNDIHVKDMGRLRPRSNYQQSTLSKRTSNVRAVTKLAHKLRDRKYKAQRITEIVQKLLNGSLTNIPTYYFEEPDVEEVKNEVEFPKVVISNTFKFHNFTANILPNKMEENRSFEDETRCSCWKRTYDDGEDYVKGENLNPSTYLFNTVFCSCREGTRKKSIEKEDFNGIPLVVKWNIDEPLVQSSESGEDEYTIEYCVSTCWKISKAIKEFIVCYESNNDSFSTLREWEHPEFSPVNPSIRQYGQIFGTNDDVNGPMFGKNAIVNEQVSSLFEGPTKLNVNYQSQGVITWALLLHEVSFSYFMNPALKMLDAEVVVYGIKHQRNDYSEIIKGLLNIDDIFDMICQLLGSRVNISPFNGSLCENIACVCTSGTTSGTQLACDDSCSKKLTGQVYPEGQSSQLELEKCTRSVDACGAHPCIWICEDVERDIPLTESKLTCENNLLEPAMENREESCDILNYRFLHFMDVQPKDLTSNYELSCFFDQSKHGNIIKATFDLRQLEHDVIWDSKHRNSMNFLHRQVDIVMNYMSENDLLARRFQCHEHVASGHERHRLPAIFSLYEGQKLSSAKQQQLIRYTEDVPEFGHTAMHAALMTTLYEYMGTYDCVVVKSTDYHESLHHLPNKTLIRVSNEIRKLLDGQKMNMNFEGNINSVFNNSTDNNRFPNIGAIEFISRPGLLCSSCMATPKLAQERNLMAIHLTRNIDEIHAIPSLEMFKELNARPLFGRTSRIYNSDDWRHIGDYLLVKRNFLDLNELLLDEEDKEANHEHDRGARDEIIEAIKRGMETDVDQSKLLQTFENFEPSEMSLSAQPSTTAGCQKVRQRSISPEPEEMDLHNTRATLKLRSSKFTSSRSTYSRSSIYRSTNARSTGSTSKRLSFTNSRSSSSSSTSSSSNSSNSTSSYRTVISRFTPPKSPPSK